MLDAIRAEFDNLVRDVYMNKTEKENIEHKMTTQLQEMHNFQQTLIEIERQQQAMKKQYEEEIARLRQQLEQAQVRAGQHAPMPPSSSSNNNSNSNNNSSGSHPQPPPPAPPSHHQQQQQPPSIGPGSSNYFGGIMNAHGNGNSQGPPPPGLMAPPQAAAAGAGGAGDHALPPHYPPSSQAPPPPPPGSAPGYMNGSGQGYGGGYPPRGSGPAPGTPTSSHAAPITTNDPAGTPKRKSASSMNGPMSSGPPPPPPGNNSAMVAQQQQRTKGQMGGGGGGGGSAGGPTTPVGLSDVDPDSVPPNMKVEGRDWFALFNPKTSRYLKVDLLHSIDHPSVVCCVKFSADGRWMAAGCNRATYIYDVATANLSCVLQDDGVQKDGDLYIRSVCFSPDGKYLATGAEDKQIRIWDIGQRQIRNVFRGHEQDIYSLDFSRDGRVIVSGSGDRTVRIWSMIEQKEMHCIPIQDLDQKDPGVTSVAISPDSRLVAAGSLDKMVRVWDIHTAQPLERLEGHKDSVYSVAFTPDGRSLVSGSLDKTIKMWQLGNNDGRGYGGMDRDRSKGPCKMTFTGHKDFVLSVACTPDGNWIVSGSKDRGVQFWDPRTGQTQFMLQGHKNSVISVAISPSGRPLFATGSGDNRARIWSYEPLGK
ncbi:WD40-repeat-containing domain protein [Zychaea mexicana]|uniref:WD40-repeat-containing domain protein n=1 Tax=Zychaea mexicana TaxID=64656 RepID=UPI0022FE834B|nr:WD40-repeat-containing domain protein [Zychaea mexicana]KAI9491939.1 WD40-repeat-containing domain protein [Zychaea mexicana]